MDEPSPAKPASRDISAPEGERPRRPILRLKNPPPLPRPPTPPAKWKCKPCGAALEIKPDLAPDDIVRCPACNARLGRAEGFRPGATARVRARQA